MGAMKDLWLDELYTAADAIKKATVKPYTTREYDKNWIIDSLFALTQNDFDLCTEAIPFMYLMVMEGPIPENMSDNKLGKGLYVLQHLEDYI